MKTDLSGFCLFHLDSDYRILSSDAKITKCVKVEIFNGKTVL